MFHVAKGAGNRLDEIEAKLLEVFRQPLSEQKVLAVHVADLLLKHRLGFDKSDNISQKLEEIAIHFEKQKDYFFARHYLTAASSWYQKAKKSEKSNEMLQKVAEYFVAEAELRQSEASVAASLYTNAIQQYRKIPKKYRSKFDVDNRVLQLRNLMQDASLNSAEQFKLIKTNPIDISDLMTEAHQRVTDKNIHEALVAFLNMVSIRKVENRKKDAEEMMQRFTILSLCPTTHTSEDGRVVAYSEAGCIWSKMLEDYQREIQLVTKGCILPALETLRLEHRLTELDFYSLASYSPLVPQRNKRLIAKALFFGYDGDYITALHILAPQMESLVRYQLKQSGEQTTHIDTESIEEEIGLNSLVNNPKMKEIFGEDLTFEIKALFCDSIGLNFRNEIAHGLISYDKGQSVESIYAWWLMFKLIFNTFWNKYYETQSKPA